MDETEDNDCTGAEGIVLEPLTEETNVDKCAANAWDRIGENLIECGLELVRHEKAMTQLNEDLALVYECYTNPQERKLKTDLVKGQMLAETKEHRAAIRYPIRMLMKQLVPIIELANTCAPNLTDLPEWYSQEALEQAARAQVAVMTADMALMEANMNLMKIRKAMAEQQEAMGNQKRKIQAMMNLLKPKVDEEKAKTEKKPEAKAEQAPPKGANVFSTRDSIMQPAFRRGM